MESARKAVMSAAAVKVSTAPRRAAMKATAVGVAAAVRSTAVKSAAVRVPAASVGSVPAMRRGRGTRCAGDNAGYNQENAFEEGRLPHLIPPSNLRTGLGVRY